ncbi:MAG: hypothetical protein WCS70_16010 [Verrucomicrobiota bacterium]|jgi:hypothetical protein
MGVEIIALIGALLALIPVVISALNRRKANRNDLGKVEVDELDAGMSRVDKLFPDQ